LADIPPRTVIPAKAGIPRHHRLSGEGRNPAPSPSFRRRPESSSASLDPGLRRDDGL